MSSDSAPPHPAAGSVATTAVWASASPRIDRAEQAFRERSRFLIQTGMAVARLVSGSKAVPSLDQEARSLAEDLLRSIDLRSRRGPDRGCRDRACGRIKHHALRAHRATGGGVLRSLRYPRRLQIATPSCTGPTTSLGRDLPGPAGSPEQRRVNKSISQARRAGVTRLERRLEAPHHAVIRSG